jgi:hypothetical protein
VFFKTLAILIDLDLQLMAWAGLFLMSILGITLGLAALFLTTLTVWQIVRRKSDREFDSILVYIFRITALGLLATFLAIIIFAYCIGVETGTKTLERLLVYTIVTAPLTGAIIGGGVYWYSWRSRRRRRRRKRF